MVASLLCGVAFGAEIPNLDDLGIDPWGEYEQLPSVLPTVQPMPSQVPGVEEGEDVYFLGEDVGIVSPRRSSASRASSVSSYSYSIPSGGIKIGGTDGLSIPKSGSFGLGYTSFSTKSHMDSSFNGLGVQIVAGTKVTVTWNVDIAASQVSKIYLNGNFSLYPAGRVIDVNNLTHDMSLSGYGEYQLLINGNAVGNIYYGNSMTLSNVAFDVVDNVYTVGVQITYPSYISKAMQVSPSVKSTSYSIGFLCNNSLSVVVDEKGGASETNGLLGSIIDFLNLMLQGITNIFTTLAELPGQIVSALIDGLKSLFIPSSDDIENIKAQYMTLLEERLGFLWQAMTFITDTAQKFLTALEGSSDYVFNLPALTITLPSGEFTLVQAQTIDFDNGLMTVVRTAAGTMFSFVVVLGFLNVSEKMVIAIVSGKSYFDYLKGGGEE